MHVEPLGLETGEGIGDGLEAIAHGVEVFESFLQPEVPEVVRAEFVAQEGGKLLVLLEKGVLEVGAEDEVAVIDAVEGGGLCRSSTTS